MAKERKDVAVGDQWNVNSFYPNFESWQKEFETTANEGATPHWPQLNQFKGKLGQDAQTLKQGLDLCLSLERKLHHLYTYAHLRHDEDITNETYKKAYSRTSAILNDFQQETAWFEPELLAIPDQKMSALLASDTLKPYRFYIEKIIRIKPHMLPPEQEELLALAGRPLQSVHRAFSAINDADFKFGVVRDSSGKEHELTHGLYGLYVRDQDRELRKNAFLSLHGKFEAYENTLCELINGQVQAHLFNAKARKYPSCVDAALFPKNIDTSVYHSLIEAVHQEIDALHRYVDLRKKSLGVGQLHLYDMQVPLAAQVEIKIPYHEAEDLIVESVAPLGADYQNILRKGLKSDRWVDRYENKNKRSGAYSSGSYDSMPYILMNYKELLRDTCTLAHEAGHSMHSYLTHKNQPYQYGNYSIFLAEVASTFNEDLLLRMLINRAKSKEEKIYLITQKIDDIRGTLFRQTMFAEFELYIHQLAEKNIPITPQQLKEKYRSLNEFYYGKEVILDKESDAEWARIPHFYYNYYVFQYATGISAALALAARVLEGGATEREDYLRFLKGGSSKYPIEMLSAAGVDMRTPAPVKAAIQKFRVLTGELKQLL